jgi:hypothetical protein
MQIYYRAGAKSHRALCIRNLPKISWQRKLKGHTYVVRFVLITYNTSGSVFLWGPQGEASLAAPPSYR